MYGVCRETCRVQHVTSCYVCVHCPTIFFNLPKRKSIKKSDGMADSALPRRRRHARALSVPGHFSPSIFTFSHQRFLFSDIFCFQLFIALRVPNFQRWEQIATTTHTHAIIGSQFTSVKGNNRILHQESTSSTQYEISSPRLHRGRCCQHRRC